MKSASNAAASSTHGSVAGSATGVSAGSSRRAYPRPPNMSAWMTTPCGVSVRQWNVMGRQLPAHVP